MTATRKQSQIDNARMILGIEGARKAAHYLRKCGWSCEAALYILLGV